MTRIVAGAAGGIPLKSVPGDSTRPTTDRVKEALFSRLESYDVLANARVLDLYAGAGSLGIEAASRGARSVLLVELAPKAVAVCQTNAGLVNKALRNSALVSVRRGSVDSVLDSFAPVPGGTAGKSWNLVFMDPPYPLSEEELATTLEKVSLVLDVDATVVIERSTRSPEPIWPAGMERFAEKKYGETRLWFAEPIQVGTK
ncbi:16S rRNA (guanine(966)-N(2))-methyltransferase RsmD [Paeniglutamicibacter terrestris]|uniref:16S rRNA (Guanine(966)-N(2))-methyltransferase RsmD n=1 Tax=Paeniglutamicibacter terrestris TaxID=2723403 RepID=A0ABX1GB12_9MICC|nr:16S rRNA (guanine(966)-N(2))-methyltransferase RsmD [Paeniglutamicibacter terrestris]NKG22700.1 16S rRNA (guanine(966)-N(2))-methyltransferase RsmD [Paeniglutamicibacter terrestris]